MSSIYGNLFKISTWGESHGKTVGVVIDGCPSRLSLSVEDIQQDLSRRRPGRNKLTTQRKEADTIEIMSGLYEGQTLGSPIAMMVRNQDQKPQDYDTMKDLYRPSHADYTYIAKYGIRDHRGGGRTSARETIARVAAGAVAKKLLKDRCGMEIFAYVSQIGPINCHINPLECSFDQIEASPVRCPSKETSALMEEAIMAARQEGDSLGGVIQVVINNVPPGLGEPVFHRAEAELARAFLSIPATKGFEIGSGFGGTRLKGSQHNDPFYMENGRVRTATNLSGGIQGGITNGEPVLCRVAFKPTSTIMKPQQTVDVHGQPAQIAARGRHDPCVVPRGVVVAEAMAALTFADLYLEFQARRG